MRKVAWIGALALLFGIWAYMAAPEVRFQAAPEVSPAAEPDVERIKALAGEIDEVDLRRVERMPTGVIEVDAEYTGEHPPRTDQEWNLLAKQIANELAASPDNIQTIHVFLHHEGLLRSQGVTTRSE